MIAALLLVFWGSFVLGLSGAVMPGPVLTATISEVTKRGFRAGPLIVVGHGILEILLLVALIHGLGDWLGQDRVRGWLGVGGGLILAGFGIQMILTAARTADDAQVWQPDPRAALHGPVLAGGLTTLSNPYWYVWWGSIGLSFAVESMAWGWTGLVTFYIGHILSDLAWFSLVAVAVAQGRRVISPKVYSRVIRACGGALILIGALFVRAGLGHLIA
jgi:threonine/homoserine/homoserine lactone efflux protein